MSLLLTSGISISFGNPCLAFLAIQDTFNLPFSSCNLYPRCILEAVNLPYETIIIITYYFMNFILNL